MVLICGVDGGDLLRLLDYHAVMMAVHADKRIVLFLSLVMRWLYLIDEIVQLVEV